MLVSGCVSERSGGVSPCMVTQRLAVGGRGGGI